MSKYEVTQTETSTRITDTDSHHWVEFTSDEKGDRVSHVAGIGAHVVVLVEMIAAGDPKSDSPLNKHSNALVRHSNVVKVAETLNRSYQIYLDGLDG